MADTARDKDDTKELFDSAEKLIPKIKRLADVLRNCRHAIAFTGAGISTSAGIPDFRSGVNTCLDTGAGKWEAQAYKKATGKAAAPPKKPTTSALRAYPTYTHMALKALLEHGVLKFLVSQNTDGLHRRSGVPPGMLAELHGNGNLETCPKCGQQYLRDFRTRTNKAVHRHETGRTCDDPKCPGKLKDTIINFGENLPVRELDAAETHAARADVCIALGSSLTVTPAANGPRDVGRKRNGNLFILNLQPTPLDDLATERLNGKCDEVMRLLMKELRIEVPAWKLERGVKIETREVTLGSGVSGGTHSGGLASARGSIRDSNKNIVNTNNTTAKKSTSINITVDGFDPKTLLPFMLFESVTLFSSSSINSRSTSSNTTVFEKTVRSPPFAFKLGEAELQKMGGSKQAWKQSLFVKMQFMKHYNEPALVLPVYESGASDNGGLTRRFEIALDFTQPEQWSVREMSPADVRELQFGAGVGRERKQKTTSDANNGGDHNTINPSQPSNANNSNCDGSSEFTFAPPGAEPGVGYRIAPVALTPFDSIPLNSARSGVLVN